MHMKRLSVLILIIALLLTLSACQTYLFGEYENELSGRKYEFMNNEFILTEGENEITGTYSIKKDSITFKYDDTEVTYSYGRDGTSAIIDGVEYKRGL